jgi:hypothetical protein
MLVRNACPAGWKKAQVHANLHHLSLAAQIRYYTGLGNIEPNENDSHQKETKTSHQRKGEHSAYKIKPNKPLKRNQKYCKIHGKCNHSSSQCDMIRKHFEEYKSTTNNKNLKKGKPLTAQSIIPDHIHAKSKNKIIPSLLIRQMTHLMPSQKSITLKKCFFCKTLRLKLTLFALRFVSPLLHPILNTLTS